ncbi:MAG: phosphoribosylanthranilate isomerase [Armatimonadetes bacterium]|nr:phosphoribosylanthranilate isomerase [Armatimonadota bacterium]
MPHRTPASSYRLEAVKICGMTNVEDRDLAADAGADYFGVLVDVTYSPRTLTLDKAKPLFESPPIPGVVLLFNANLGRVQAVVDTLKPFAVQLLGHEPPELIASLKSSLDCQVWKSLHVPPRGHGEIDVEEMKTLAEEYEDSGVDVLLFGTVDASGNKTKFGGTGLVSDWTVIRGLVTPRIVPSFLAGGLSSNNISAAIQSVKPYGIDICTSVESSPGKKDCKKLAELFEVLSAFRSN